MPVGRNVTWNWAEAARQLESEKKEETKRDVGSCRIVVSPSTVPGPAASTLPRSLLEIQHLVPHPDKLTLKLRFNIVMCALQFGKHGVGHTGTCLSPFLPPRRAGSQDL